ncbi:MAG TPA: methyltransferase domain-containing protein [Polyangiaceae bacterium]
MREQLLEVLAEPGTGAKLELRDARGQRQAIEEGTLVSTETGRKYPIVRGIPRFVDASNYTASFGMQWNAFRDVQLDSVGGGSHSRDRFDAETRWDEATLKGKWVLDGGCGAGRFAEVAAARGANLVALDMSSAVEAAKKTLAPYPSVDVVQGSLLEPPLRRGSMDFAYCIGVAQHTPSPMDAVRQVVEAVKPGGEFALSIYARRPWTKLNAKYLIRPLTKRLPKDVLLGAIERVMPVVFPVADVLFWVPKVGKVARFVIPLAVYAPEERPTWGREQRYQEAILDTLDMLSPAFDSPMTWQEVERVLKGVGAKSWEFATRVPINVIGKR